MRLFSTSEEKAAASSSLVYTIDPCKDPRWGTFVDRHPHGSVFHSVPWLAALQSTYAYEPVVYTTSAPDTELTNGIAFCRVKSWFTGRRLVSLPFSDYCEPLVNHASDSKIIFDHLTAQVASEGWKYVEVRPLHLLPPIASGLDRWSPCKQYYLHSVHLGVPEDQLLRSFHRSSVQYRIRKALREGLVYTSGRSDALLEQFYRLILVTRRRHGLPPQPEQWFRNLAKYLGDGMEIHVASYDKLPVSSIMTLRTRKKVIYKYGGSIQKYNRLGSMPFLLWKAIQAAKANGAEVFDLGRSNCDHYGLVNFKDHWGTEKARLTYLQFPTPSRARIGAITFFKLAKNLPDLVPDVLFKVAGELLYRHIG